MDKKKEVLLKPVPLEKQLSVELKNLRRKYDELTEWISQNTSHPDFLKKISERNDLSVQIEVKKQQKNGDWFTITPSPYTVIN